MNAVEAEIRKGEDIYTVSWAVIPTLQSNTWVVCVPYNQTMVGFYRLYNPGRAAGMSEAGAMFPDPLTFYGYAMPSGSDFTKCYSANTLKRLLERWLENDGFHSMKGDAFSGETNLIFRARCGDGVSLARSEIEALAAWL